MRFNRPIATMNRLQSILSTQVYYKCPNCEACLTESVICVSGASRHDRHAVLTFVKRTIDHLQQVRNLQVSHVVQWSDGCGAQYKSKGPLVQSRCAVVGWLWSTVQEQVALTSVTLCSGRMAVEHSTRARAPSLIWQPVYLTVDGRSTAATSDRGMAKVLVMGRLQ